MNPRRGRINDQVRIRSLSDDESVDSRASYAKKNEKSVLRSRSNDNDDESVNSKASNVRKREMPRRVRSNDNDDESVDSKASYISKRDKPLRRRSNDNDDESVDSRASHWSKRDEALRRRSHDNDDDESVDSRASHLSKRDKPLRRRSNDHNDDESVDSRASKARRGKKEGSAEFNNYREKLKPTSTNTNKRDKHRSTEKHNLHHHSDQDREKQHRKERRQDNDSVATDNTNSKSRKSPSKPSKSSTKNNNNATPVTTTKRIYQQNSNSHVYIYTKEHSWIPAKLSNAKSDDDDIATVFVPKFETEEELVMTNPQKGGGSSSRVQKRTEIQTVKLHQYENNVLPLQNVDDDGKFQEYEDMVNLPYIHEAAILYNIKYRHYNGKPYTRTGDIVIAVNPYKWYNDLYTEKNRNLYSKKLVWDIPMSGNDPREMVQPHVYEISSLSYKGMACDNENQSILVSGESGAGKTETVKICMDHIASLQRGPSSSTSTTSESNSIDMDSNFDNNCNTSQLVVQKILDSNPLLEAFGNSKTRRNDNSSRFGKFIQLQFSKNKNASSPAALVGSKCEVYLLEKNRIVSHDTQERNFHIFYQLLAADDEEKKEIWSNLKSDTFKYIGETTTRSIEGVSDHDQYVQTKKVLDLIGINGKKFKALMRAMCVVLQLGNIRFVGDKDDSDKSSVSSKSDIKSLGKLMGISDTELALAFTERTVKTRQETYKVPLNAEKAKDTCDIFAKEIYGRVFLWLVDIINKATCAEEEHAGEFNTIGLLDIFGFESFEVNRFEQLCINYANEKLQNKFTEDIFRSIQNEYEQEGVPLGEITFSDNADVLDIIEGTTGILCMLNEECVRPQGNAGGFVYKTLQRNKKTPVLIKDEMDSIRFGIKHYAGTVMYDADDFVTKNLDTLPIDLLECGGKCSKNSIISDVFQDAAGIDNTATTATAGGSTRNHGSSSSRSLPKRQNSFFNSPTVGTKYKNQLSKLMVNLDLTQTRYIRCIKPNTMKKPLVMENNITVNQLRSAGVIAGVTIARESFPNRLQNEIVFRRYKFMWDHQKFPSTAWSRGATQEKLQDDCTALLTCALKSKEYVDQDDHVIKAFVVGKTRTYFRSGALEYLESKRLKSLDAEAIAIQKIIRGHLARKQTQEQIKQIEAEKQEQKLKEKKAKKEAEERKNKKNKKLEKLKDKIEGLKKKIHVADDEKEAAIEEARQRKLKAIEAQEELREKIESGEEKYEKREKGITMHNMALKVNQKRIAFLKKENSHFLEKQAKLSKKFKKCSVKHEKLQDVYETNSSAIEEKKAEKERLKNKHEELKSTFDPLVTKYKTVCYDIKKEDKEYWAVANERNNTQKQLADIITLIQKKCKNDKLLNDTQDLAHECEYETTMKMIPLDAEYGFAKTSQ